MRFARLAVALLLLATAETAGADDMEAAWLARGAWELAPFKAQLQAALKEGLASGPASAIEVCRVRAPEIAGALRSETVEVGRSSHKLRKPANAPRPWLQPILSEYLQEPDARRPRAARISDDRVGYAEPILVQPLCLSCHGAVLAEPVAEKIDALYPADQATGFGVGDLRGVFWAEFPAD